MSTELMGWQYGTTSPIPIPIEPPMPGHRYVRDPNSPPVCFTALIHHSDIWTFIPLLTPLPLHLQPPVEYMDQVLEMVASLEGMVLRREAQLSIMGFQVPISFLAFIILLMIC